MRRCGGSSSSRSKPQRRFRSRTRVERCSSCSTAATWQRGTRPTASHDVAFHQETLGARSFLIEDRYLKEGVNAAIIHVAEPLDTLQRTFTRAREAIGIVLAATAVAVVIFSIVFASQATTPINQLSR